MLSELQYLLLHWLSSKNEIQLPTKYRWDISKGGWLKLAELPTSSFCGSGLAWIQCSALDVLDEVEKCLYDVSAVFPDGTRHIIYPTGYPVGMALEARLQGEKDNPDLIDWRLNIVKPLAGE